MHTLTIIGIGLGLLAVCVLVARLVGGANATLKALLAFVPLWFVGAAINMYIGVAEAGYTVADELPVFLVVFGVPAAIALLLWRRKK